MSAPRRFDWDEARRLRSDGWTYQKLADHFGVTLNAVWFACNDEARHRATARTQAWQRAGVCPDCGDPATRHGGGIQSRCVKCALTRLTYVRDGRAHCPTCEQWKPLAEFTPCPSKPYRGVRTECRACETTRRREYRRAHPEVEAAAGRRRRHRKAAA
jgi:hypothetical protein